MRVALFLTILILSFASFTYTYSQKAIDFVYDDRNKRDPFIPLVDKNGRYLLESERIYSSDELNLSGILWDPRGRSSALINNQVVKVGESIGGFVLKKIAKNSVIISRKGKDYIIRLTIEDFMEEKER